MESQLTDNFWKIPETSQAAVMQAVDELDKYAIAAPSFSADFTGDKFPGSFGPTQLFQYDYWTLRQRSDQIFKENLYGRGLIRRLITNEINTGLTPEAGPDEEVIGVPDDSLATWTEKVENRFGIWGKSPQACDFERTDTFGKIQRTARMEALIGGDVLVVLRQSARTQTPAVQLVRGEKVRSPFGGDEVIPKGHKVVEGVERDKARRIVAYWIVQEDGTSKRLSAFGANSGQRRAWLVFGTEKRIGQERGEPLLSLVLSSLKEIDRYRDSTQRKAVVNSILAMFIKKTEDKPSSLPSTGGAVRRNTTEVTDSDGTTRQFTTAKQIPGMVMQELQQGEEPVGFQPSGAEESFGTFEAAVLRAIAWANELPPEVLELSFNKAFNASQAAINELKMYLRKIWSDFGESFCNPIYQAFVINDVLRQNISAQGLLEAWRDPLQYDVFGAWMSVEWFGAVKPSTDIVKQAKGSKLLIDLGMSTHAREARHINGSKFTKNAKKLEKENAALAKAMRPLLELQRDFGATETASALSAIRGAADDVLEAVGGLTDGD